MNYKDENNRRVVFNNEQVNELISLETMYYDTWFSFVTEFIDKSFYLKTEGNKVDDLLNRHAILHEMGFEFSYDFENYIKIYFVLQFLTWAFLQKEGKSILNQIGGYKYLDKIYSYKKIIEISEKLCYEKHILYEDKKGYEAKLLKQKFSF